MTNKKGNVVRALCSGPSRPALGDMRTAARLLPGAAVRA